MPTNTGCIKRIAVGIVFLALFTAATISSLYANSVSPNNAYGGGGATCAATASPIPTISVPAATSTTGNTVLTESNFSSTPSQTTHDMIVCGVQQSTGANSFQIPMLAGFNPMTTAVQWNGTTSWAAMFSRCVAGVEPASFQMGNLANDASVSTACILLRNTGCGDDGNAATSNNTTSTTLTYPAILTTQAKDMLVYFSPWGAANSTTLTPPASVTTTDINNASVAATSAGLFMGHVPQATATTVASTTGTLNHSEVSIGMVARIVPIH